MATGHFTIQGSNLYLNHLFRGQQKSTGPSYLAPFITMPSKQGAGSEPAGSSRILMSALDWQAPAGGQTTTIRNLVFPRSTGWNGNVVALGIFDSASAGNCLAYYIPDDGELIEVNDSLIVLAGGLLHRFDAGFMSLNLQNAILNDLYRSIPLPIFPALSLAHYSSAPAPNVSPTVGGIEPTDPAYSRQPAATNGTVFNAASGGKITTSLPFTYTAATVSQGSRSYWGLHDAPTAGNFQIGGTLTPKTVDIGDPLTITQITIGLDAA
jgi:hypothetical protein